MSGNPVGPDREVRRPPREGGIPTYPFIILVVVVMIAVVGIIVLFT
jgi:hypothetical protein